MRTRGDCQAKGRRGRKIPCLGSTTFIWAFYLFFLQALGKYFKWKFSILQKMHLPCADCTTPDLGREYDHKKHSPGTLLPCYTTVHSPTVSTHTESEDWSHLLTRRTRFLGHRGKELSCVQVLCLQPSYMMHDRTTHLCWADLWQSSAPCPTHSISHTLTLSEPKPGYSNGH